MKRTRMKMGKRGVALAALLAALALAGYGVAFACTSIAVSKGASVDGSVMTSQTGDGGIEEPTIKIVPAADYKAGEMRKVYWNSTLRSPKDPQFEPLTYKGEIPQAAHTYAYTSAIYGVQNEHQLSFGETTIWVGERPELRDPEGMFDIVELSHVAAERCKTAREAVKLMGELVNTYGYCDGGECLTVADPNEVWFFEVYGATPLAKSGVWAAQRVPDGEIGVSANRARIGEIDLKKADYFMASPNVTSLAKEKGWWDGKKAFSFRDAYCPDNGSFYSQRREWRALSLLAPSLKLDPWTRAFPFSVKPDKKVAVADITRVFRDHYEGTEFDLTKGLAAGPFGSPDRFATQSYNGGTWERALSIYRAEYSWISQSRSWLPDAVGGVVWWGWDAPHATCYVPLYCGNTALPAGYDIGYRGEFDRNSASWAFAFVQNISNLRYDLMSQDIKARYTAIEAEEFALQSVVEKAAAELYAKDKALAVAYLTKYSVDTGNGIVQGWWKFGEQLIAKYNDGYRNVKKAGEKIGYPEEWLKAVGYGPIQKK